MKYLNFLYAIIFLLSFSTSLFSQNNHFIGYKKDVSGVNFNYHSPFSYNDNCYLTRANKSVAFMEWETEAVPESYNKKTISFIWTRIHIPLIIMLILSGCVFWSRLSHPALCPYLLRSWGNSNTILLQIFNNSRECYKRTAPAKVVSTMQRPK